MSFFCWGPPLSNKTNEDEYKDDAEEDDAYSEEREEGTATKGSSKEERDPLVHKARAGRASEQYLHVSRTTCTPFNGSSRPVGVG